MVSVFSHIVKLLILFYRCIQNCHRERTLPNELLFLKAKVYGKHGSSQKVNSTKRFQWSCSKGNNSTPYSLQSKKLENLPNHMLAVRQGFFELGTSYTIMLQGACQIWHFIFFLSERCQ